MVTVSSAASAMVQFFLGLYLVLWRAAKATMGTVYSTLRIISNTYPPARQFLINLEHSIVQVKHNPAEVQVQTLLQQFWTPSTTLEGLVSSACCFSLICCHAHQVYVWMLIVRTCWDCRDKFRWLSQSRWPFFAAQVRLRHPYFVWPNALTSAQRVSLAAGLVLLACFVVTCIFAISVMVCLPVGICCAVGESALLLQLFASTCRCSPVLQVVLIQVSDC